MASIPTAPLPANRSSQTESATIGATTLKSVSRRRSEVGRVCMPGGASSLRLFYFPAITRMTSNLPYRITDRLGCSDLRWMDDQQRARLARRAACNKRRRITGPKLQVSGLERSEKTLLLHQQRARLAASCLQQAQKNYWGQSCSLAVWSVATKKMRNWSVFTARFGGREVRIHLTFVVLLLFLLLVAVNRSGPRVIRSEEHTS